MDIFSGFFQTIQQGGWEMWLLLLISIVAVAVVIERLVFFQTQHGDTKGLLAPHRPADLRRRPRGRIKICKQNKGMLPRILEFGLAAARRTAPTSPTRSRSR